MDRINELAEKRKRQTNIASKIARNMEEIKRMSDVGIRLINLNEINPCFEVNGVEISQLYSFAMEYLNDTGENILVEPMQTQSFGEKTLIWSCSDILNLAYNRGINKKQYECLEAAANKYLASKK